MVTGPRFLRTRPDGFAVYGYGPIPGSPPVSTVVLADAIDDGVIPTRHAHAHDFFVIIYFEGDGGGLRIGQRDVPVAAGDVHLVAPGDVVGIGPDIPGLRAARGRSVYFSAEALGADANGSILTWWTHPLLFPFARFSAGELKRWNVPAADRAGWSARLRTIDRELEQRRHGHREAVVASLVLLLVDVGRLARSSAEHLALGVEPPLTQVFAFIDQHYHEPISLRDVARAVSLSPGHLTTVIGRMSGRTVQVWITERRLAEARRLLVDTDLAVDEIGRCVGYPDPSYFARMFRKAHGTTPLGWRRAARTLDQSPGV